MGGHEDPMRIIDGAREDEKLIENRLPLADGSLPLDIAVGQGCTANTPGDGEYCLRHVILRRTSLPAQQGACPRRRLSTKIDHIGGAIKYGLQEEDMHLSSHRVKRDKHGQVIHALKAYKAAELHPRITGQGGMQDVQ
jgi:hypothetical protein